MFILDTIAHRLKRGCATMAYPDGPAPALPDRHGGALRIDPTKCNGCADCASACPTGAITYSNTNDTGNRAQLATLDLGRCLFCNECIEACPDGAIVQTGDHRMATRQRDDLILAPDPSREQIRLAAALDEKLRKLFGRSLKLRQVSAGGCNACEADVNVLGTIGWDLSRFGIQFVASPRHADGLLITGPVSQGMELALKKTWDAVPDPKLVIATGACAISGGPFAGNPQTLGGASAVVPVDLYIPGCPPHPLTILDGLLRLLGRLEEQRPLTKTAAASAAEPPPSVTARS
ncbi:4Fe-4S dicluster domain-containing protein [Opitutaceae bacterium TAV4]|nr:4Fe-4S dicluster domain-containing protein [Opitutaceae bacterium TAV4]RRJ98590.1 4Fe-4S dicluster domain-containing protein [Opitutaceae bacterium TAV3]